MKKLIFIGAGIICLIIIVVACSRNKKKQPQLIRKMEKF